jgi:hypothetical protein
MKNNTINPLSTMSVEQLKELLKGIDKEFLKHVKDGVIIEDYSIHLDRYQYFLNYLCENKVTFSKGGETLNLSYGLMAQILITHELNNRLNNNKMENQETSKGYICPKTQLQCDDECCVSAEKCHIQESEGLGLKSEMTNKQSSVEFFWEKLEEKGNAHIETEGVITVNITIDVNEYRLLKKQAKERFEQQIKRAFIIGGGVEYHEINTHADEYFIEEFGGNK